MEKVDLKSEIMNIRPWIKNAVRGCNENVKDTALTFGNVSSFKQKMLQ